MFCGAKPAVYILPGDAITANLVEAAARGGYATERWRDPLFGPQVVAGDPVCVREVAALCRDLRALSSARQERLGRLLGYPASAATWFAHRATEGFGNPGTWTPDERRFLLCAFPRDPAGLALGRAWAGHLLASFTEAYGQEAVARLPYAEFPESVVTSSGRPAPVWIRPSLVYQG